MDTRNITPNDLTHIDYYPVPKWLMDLFISGQISQGAFKTYVLMYDRLRLSAKNGWIENGVVYIKYSYDELQEDLKSNSRTTISNNLKDLEKAGLIEKIKGYSTSCKFYLRTYNPNNFLISSPENYTNTENCTPVVQKDGLSLVQKIGLQKSRKVDSNKNNIIKNNFSKNNFSKNNSDFCQNLDNEKISVELKNKILEYVEYRKEIKKPIKTFLVITKLLNRIGKDFINESHLIESIELSISNQYQGVFPSKITNSRQNQKESYLSRMIKGGQYER